jgi:rhomboid protease GluP
VTYRANTEPEPVPPPPSDRPLRLPVSDPFITYILIAAIVIVWVITKVASGGPIDGEIRGQVLVDFGANFGQLILQGETWRLFTSMFLHGNLLHLAFNGYALFIFGLEMERLYGPDRFIIVYVLSGLFGSLASFATWGPDVFSVGASGAIFGVIGMNLAFFLLHRDTFGEFGRQRTRGVLIIIGINLVFGFIVPRVDNMAHIGGLVAGFLLAYGLAPRYKPVDLYTSNPRVIDTISLLKRWWVPALGAVGLAVGTSLALSFWVG